MQILITKQNIKIDQAIYEFEDIPSIFTLYNEILQADKLELAKIYNRLTDKRNISLDLKNNFFYVDDFPVQHKQELINFFSYKVVDEYRLVGTKNEDWNGTRSVIKQFGTRIKIPFTLYDRFKFFCSVNKLGIKRDIIIPKIDYSYPEIDVVFNPDITLRYYQEEAVNILLQYHSGIVAIAGGGGKTLIMAKIIAETKLPTIVFINSIDIGLQLQSQFKRFLGTCGFVGAGKEHWDIQKDVNVVLIQTAYLALWTAKKIKKWIVSEKNNEDEEDFDNNISKTDKKIFEQIESNLKPEDYEELVAKMVSAGHLVFDEGDLVVGPSTYSKVSLILPALFRRLFSATPHRNDYADLEINATAGEILYTKTMAELIREGFLTPIHSFVIRLVQPLANIGSKFPSIYKNTVIENPEPKMAMVLLIKFLFEQGYTRGFVLCTQIKQVTSLTKYFLEADINVNKLTGDEKNPLVRKQALERIANGKTNVLVTTVMKRGIDLPNLDFVIRAYGLGKSETGLPNSSIHQEMSRLTRLAEGKKKGIYITFFYPFPYVSDHSRLVIAGIEQEKAGPITYLTTDDLLQKKIEF